MGDKIMSITKRVNIMEEAEAAVLDRSRHIEYFRSHLLLLPYPYQSQDHNRIVLVRQYYILLNTMIISILLGFFLCSWTCSSKCP